MAFVNLSLLFGAALIALPIVMHLTMRQQPKHFTFPAIRFLKQRRESNKRNLKLRHWLLLFLRCAILGIAAFMLARPSTSSTTFGNWLIVAAIGILTLGAGALTASAAYRRRGALLVGGLGSLTVVALIVLLVVLIPAMSNRAAGLIGDQEAPVAAAIVIDSSARMGYRNENRSRLDIARELGEWIIRQLPEDSEIAILDSRPGAAAFAVDRAAASKSLERLEPTGSAPKITSQLAEALRLVASSAKPRKEIYLLSDMSEGAWGNDDSLKSELAAAPHIALVVVDVGAKEPSDFAVRNIEISSELIARGGEVIVRAEIAHIGSGGTRSVELLLEDLDPGRPILQDGKMLVPNLKVRGQQECSFAASSSQRIEFRLRGLEEGVRHGSVRIVGEDGLAIDDERHLTFEVKAAWPVLVLSPPGVLTKFLVESISPYEWRQQGRSLFDCQVAPQSALTSSPLMDYAAVFLVDPAPLTPSEWQQLEKYVSSGGGLAIFLGPRAHPISSFNEPIAQAIIGGQIAREWRTTINDLSLSPERFEHPLLSAFRNQDVPWKQLPVYRHWVLDPLADDSHVVIPFSNRRAALIERSVGKGRVVVMTTPVSEPVEPQGRSVWNELFTADDAWPPVVLMDQIARYLVSNAESKLNYIAGEAAMLQHRPDRDPDRYQLFTPTAETQEIIPRDQRVSVRYTEAPGTYRLKGFRGTNVLRGFSVNVPASVSELSRISSARLDAALGNQRFQLATNQDEINRGIGEARVGREFYSYLLLVLVGLLAMEQLLANRFYRREVGASTPVDTALAATMAARSLSAP